MTPVGALSALAVTLVAPLLVLLLGRVKWSGDGKRLAVIVAAGILGVLQAIVTGVIVLPAGWADLLGGGLITAAGVVGLTQSWFVVLQDKLPASDYPSEDGAL